MGAAKETETETDGFDIWRTEIGVHICTHLTRERESEEDVQGRYI